MITYEITIQEDGTCILHDLTKQPPADNYHAKTFEEAVELMKKFIAMKQNMKVVQFDENGNEVKA